MDAFTRLSGRASPLLRSNVDTEVMIRINRLIDHQRDELGRWLFEPWRYRADGSENPAFELNQPRYRNACILVAGENFGCGSSREAAVWALKDFGIRSILAPSFGDIFLSNCFQNGLLPVRLDRAEIETIAAELADEANPPEMAIDLEACALTTPGGRRIGFEIAPERREALLAGLDEIGMTLRMDSEIRAYQARDRQARPWIYRHGPAQGATLLMLPGDGVGPEVMAQVRRIVTWLAERRDLDVVLDEEPFGVASWETYGSLMPDETWRKILAADAILFGAISYGSPDYAHIPPEHRQTDWLLKIRRELDLFTNLRPVRTLPALAGHSSLRPEIIAGADMVIVRELAGGIYFAAPRGVRATPDGGEQAVNTMRYSDVEVARIARAAFKLARQRDGRVCSVDKANVLEVSALWRKVVSQVHAEEFDDVELSHMFVDNCAMQLVRNPKQFDVLLTENLFGDILSDCAAMISGSLGMLPSASLGAPRADGKRHALYEPIHGSAPDIAGKNLANPLGAILSLALCLRHSLELPAEAALLEDAIEAAVAGGTYTADIAPAGANPVSTTQMGDAVIHELERRAGQ